MKDQLKTFRILFVIVSFLCLFTISGCKVTFVTAYNAQLSEQIDATAKVVDTFYQSMLDTSSVSRKDRSFSQFATQYIEIEAELNSLLNKNAIRPHNENSTRICEITLQLWVQYKEEHKKDNTLPDGIIKLNQMTFSDLFFAMQVAEKEKSR